MTLRDLFADIIETPQPQAPAVRIDIAREGAPPARPAAGYEARRAEVLAMLDADARLRRAAKFYPDVPGPDVLCTVALRDFGTAEFRVPRDRYADGWAILQALVDLGEQ